MKKNNAKSNKDDRNIFDSATLLFSIIAITLIAIGLYLSFNNKLAVGISQPTRYGQGGGTVEHISGAFVVALGIFFAIFPTIDLIRYLRARL